MIHWSYGDILVRVDDVSDAEHAHIAEAMRLVNAFERNQAMAILASIIFACLAFAIGGIVLILAQHDFAQFFSDIGLYMIVPASLIGMSTLAIALPIQAKRQHHFLTQLVRIVERSDRASQFLQIAAKCGKLGKCTPVLSPSTLVE